MLLSECIQIIGSTNSLRWILYQVAETRQPRPRSRVRNSFGAQPGRRYDGGKVPQIADVTYLSPCSLAGWILGVISRGNRPTTETQRARRSTEMTPQLPVRILQRTSSFTLQRKAREASTRPISVDLRALRVSVVNGNGFSSPPVLLCTWDVNATDPQNR